MIRLGTLIPLLGFALLGCKREVEEGAGSAPPPPPVVSSQPGVCATGGGVVKDGVSATYFPRLAGDYCIDPNSEVKTFGESSSAALDAVCELFDGECEVYKTFALKRVVTVQYVDGKGSPGIITVTLSRFGSEESAFAFFTKRVIADGDPLEGAPTPLDAGTFAALGSGVAYVFRGQNVAELRYVHELESPEELRKSSARALPTLAIGLGRLLPGSAEPLPSVALLPLENRIPSGIHYEYSDLLGVSGAGRGAVGFYREGSRRFRIFASVRPDEDSAKDVLKTLRKLSGARAVKDSPLEITRLSLRDSDTAPKVDWVIGRLGAVVAGVGDEGFVLGGSRTDEAANSLTEAEKTDRLAAILRRKPASAGSSGLTDSPAALAPGASALPAVE